MKIQNLFELVHMYFVDIISIYNTLKEAIYVEQHFFALSDSPVQLKQ